MRGKLKSESPKYGKQNKNRIIRLMKVDFLKPCMRVDVDFSFLSFSFSLFPKQVYPVWI